MRCSGLVLVSPASAVAAQGCDSRLWWSAIAASQVCWAADHTLASASERDGVVRMYNFDTEDNYVLQVSEGGLPNAYSFLCWRRLSCT